jgi:serine protease AprX
LTWVVDNHKRCDIRVVSISLGGDRPSDGNATPLDEMVEEAVARGLVVVCASGNDARTHIFPPASATSAITVGGLDDQNSMDPAMHGMYRSNWGSGVGGAPKPDLIAPAQWVAAPMVMETPTHEQAQFLWDLFEADDHTLRHRLETEFARARFNKEMVHQPIDVIRRQVRGRMNEDKLIHRHYQHVDGTSMSTPFVSGVVAQMLQANPRLTPKQVRQILRETAQPLIGVPAEQQGAGALRAGAALARALRHRHTALRKAPASVVVDGATATFTFCDSEALRVSVAGSFNGWRSDTHPLAHVDRGAWQAKIRLPKGTHRYKFILDGGGDAPARWLHDLENPRMDEDGCGGYFSVIDVA